ncbi:Helix-turn-helix domain-containing protein [Methylobacterium sp. UNCCL125]|nr:Helix-turn-helix domain-containing protein [Methylobacterium sp. UNCCL125]
MHSGKSGWHDFHFQEVQVFGEGTFESVTTSLTVSMTLGPMRIARGLSGHSFLDHPTDPQLSFPGDVGVGRWKGTQRGWHLFLKPSTVERLSGRVFRSSELRPANGTRVAIGHLLRALHVDVVTGHRSGPALGEAIASSIVQQLYDEIGLAAPDDITSPTVNARVQRLCDWIEAHIELPITLEAMAAESAVTVRQLCRIFRAATGYPPHRYILLRRIERAKLLIRNDQMSLQEIALAVGFAHQAHMTDTFRRLAGASPSHFRNKR